MTRTSFHRTLLAILLVYLAGLLLGWTLRARFDFGELGAVSSYAGRTQETLTMIDALSTDTKVLKQDPRSMAGNQYP